MREGVSEVQFVIATDGSCSPNPGPGAYGYIIQGYIDGKLILEKTAAYTVTETTNNRMEMAAILFGLYAVDETMDTLTEVSSPVVRLICDSRNAISWIDGTFTINDAAIRNYAQDIWHFIDHAQLEVKFEYVAGHSKVQLGMTLAQKLNVRVDQMLRDIRKEQ